ncbi:MAG TPA: hypothetical protein VN841_02540 [Bryobacteraceae bacterium]|nr:hypothetical protein [Bryobacteraceae bacterium]
MDRVPDAYFREMPSRCTGVELVLLGNILNETCGAGRPPWWRTTWRTLALRGCVTEPSAQDAIRNLAEKGLIARRGPATRQSGFVELRGVEAAFAARRADAIAAAEGGPR